MPPPTSLPDDVLTVSQLTHEMAGMLGATFGEVWVRGEVGRVNYHGSGHVYLTLKDADAVLECAIWRSTLRRVRFRLEEGQEVLAFGGIDLYAPQGRYKLIIRQIEPVGEGALRLAFDQLKRKLETEGLFDEATKRALPLLPRRIALVTSPTGAAIRDLVTVIRRRLPSVELVLVPVRVQGEGAAAEIARTLALADAHAGADVLVVGRGGGSLEDLQAFNEEVLARAIHAARTPVVSAVGHETDLTISDLVADVRAATPSQAGELVVPSREDLLRRLVEGEARLGRRLRSRLDHAWQRLEAIAERPVLRAPVDGIRRRRERLEHLAARLAARHPRARLAEQRKALGHLEARLHPPIRRRLSGAREILTRQEERARRASRERWKRARARLGALDDRLRALSPLAVLGRGYSITTTSDGTVVRGADDVEVGASILTRLGDGARVASRVESIGDDAS